MCSQKISSTTRKFVNFYKTPPCFCKLEYDDVFGFAEIRELTPEKHNFLRERTIDSLCFTKF